MKISTRKVAGFDVIRLEGEFLAEPEQNHFKDSVRDLVNGGSRRLVVDLASIRHINSCGLGSMVSAVLMMRNIGGDVRFAGVNRDVGRILELTHLDTVFRVYPGVPEAVAGAAAARN